VAKRILNTHYEKLMNTLTEHFKAMTGENSRQLHLKKDGKPYFLGAICLLKEEN
jgi:hypothetical protein